MERKHSIDLLRIISAVAVIVIHAVSSPVSNSANPLPLSLTTTLRIVHTLMNWSVPVFFMITGYCILGKKAYTYQHCFSHVTKYILVLLTVGFAFALLEEVSIQRTVNMAVLLQSFENVLRGNLWDHMWYVYTLIGIYLVLPVIHLFFQSGAKNRLILTGLLFFFTVFLPTVQPYITVGITLPFGGYLFYVCFGGVIANQDLGKKVTYWIILLGSAATAWLLLFRDENYGYHSLPIACIAASIFILFASANVKANTLILTVSQCTWGIYLLHPLFINIAIKVLHIDLLSRMPYLILSLFCMMLFLLSFITTYLLRRIPIIKRLF